MVDGQHGVHTDHATKYVEEVRNTVEELARTRLLLTEEGSAQVHFQDHELATLNLVQVDFSLKLRYCSCSFLNMRINAENSSVTSSNFGQSMLSDAVLSVKACTMSLLCFRIYSPSSLSMYCSYDTILQISCVPIKPVDDEEVKRNTASPINPRGCSPVQLSMVLAPIEHVLT